MISSVITMETITMETIVMETYCVCVCTCMFHIVSQAGTLAVSVCVCFDSLLLKFM